MPEKFMDMAKQTLGIPEFTDAEMQAILETTHYKEEWYEANGEFVLYDSKGTPRYCYPYEQRDSVFFFMFGMAMGIMEKGEK